VKEIMMNERKRIVEKQAWTDRKRETEIIEANKLQEKGWSEVTKGAVW